MGVSYEGVGLGRECSPEWRGGAGIVACSVHVARLVDECLRAYPGAPFYREGVE